MKVATWLMACLLFGLTFSIPPHAQAMSFRGDKESLERRLLKKIPIGTSLIDAKKILLQEFKEATVYERKSEPPLLLSSGELVTTFLGADLGSYRSGFFFMRTGVSVTLYFDSEDKLIGLIAHIRHDFL